MSVYATGAIKKLLQANGIETTEDSLTAKIAVISASQLSETIIPAGLKGIFVYDAPVRWKTVKEFKEKGFLTCSLASVCWETWKLLQPDARPLFSQENIIPPSEQPLLMKRISLAERLKESKKEAGSADTKNAFPAQEIDRIPEPDNMLLNPDTLVIASFSTKGGVGKTALASNLGTYFAMKDYPTVVVDFDLEGNLAEVLGMHKQIDKHPNTNTWKDYGKDFPMQLMKHQSGFYLLPSGRNNVLQKEEAEEILFRLSKHYQVIVMDFGTNPFAPHAKAALSIARFVYLVTIPEQGYMETLIERFLCRHKDWIDTGKAILVVNRVKPESYYQPEHVAEMGGFKNWREIPEDPAFEAAKKTGKTVMQIKNAASKEWLSAAAEVAASFLPKKEPSNQGSFLKSFFRS